MRKRQVQKEIGTPKGVQEPWMMAWNSIEQALERLDVEFVPLNEDDSHGQPTTPAEATPSSDDSDSTDVDAPSSEPPPLYEDPEEDDGEGEWINARVMSPCIKPAHWALRHLRMVRLKARTRQLSPLDA